VLAVEPSATMIAQRPPGAAPVVRAVAEQMPLADATVDAALAAMTIHHWSDWRAGVAELLRVARRRIVIWTFAAEMLDALWVARDYLPETIAVERGRTPGLDELAEALGGARVETVMVPRDCQDGVAAAFYARPECYLDPLVRAGMSSFTGLDGAPGLRRLEADLRSGAWEERYGHLRELAELDAGYRLVVAER
jgi:SAM-dependent methyltransferase